MWIWMSLIALVINSWLIARLPICVACSSSFCFVIIISCFEPRPNIDAPSEPIASSGDFWVTAPPKRNNDTSGSIALLDLWLSSL